MITIDELEKYLWGAAVDLRGLIDAGAYKEYIFPLVFLKRISDVWDEEYNAYREEALSMSLPENEADEYALEQMENSTIKIPDGCHWADVFNTTEDIGQKLVQVFKQIEVENPAKKIDGRLVGGLEGIFGDKAIWTNKNRMPDATIRNLLNNFNKLNLSLENCPADEMGTGYEYLVGQFANDAGHTAQEFYTNRTVVELMAEILQLKSGESIYDPTCGSGGMLIKSLSYLREKGEEWRDVKVYGQEINSGTASIARMNCYLHGVNEFSIVNDDTLERPAFVKGDKLEQFDVVLANPPYSIKTWNREKFEHDKYGRNFLGTPPQDCADYAFIQHILASMDDNTGRCAMLLPHGVLFRNFESNMRENLIKSDLIESVIGIGPGLFYNSPMEACIIICNRNKPADLKNKILFINALKEITRKNAESYLEKEHIKKIVSAYRNHKEVESFSRIVDEDELKSYKYDLSIQKYVFINNEEEELTHSADTYIKHWNAQSDVLKNGLNNLIDLLG